jgi:predicted helicase
LSGNEYHRVQILDPATGTGTFLAEVVRNIYRRFENNAVMWDEYVKKHLIPRLNGFEIMMSPYTMAHLKLESVIAGFDPQSHTEQNQRLQIYLTDSLEDPKQNVQQIPFAQWLSNEAAEAAKIKNKAPVMVILGNPPYSGESQNKGEWILNLMEDYKKEPTGGKLQEKNPKWLNDDYVKFIRFGQHFIEKNGEGILAYINNHSFLDNPTFRGMRYNLMKTFDKIYVIDLHGNSKKKETAPDGSKDENVFDIMQGVSINIFVKTRKSK